MSESVSRLDSLAKLAALNDDVVRLERGTGSLTLFVAARSSKAGAGKTAVAVRIDDEALAEMFPRLGEMGLKALGGNLPAETRGLQLLLTWIYEAADDMSVPGKNGYRLEIGRGIQPW
jgi:hypothetical protein